MKHINIILFTILSFALSMHKNTLPLVEVKRISKYIPISNRLITLHRYMGAGAVDDGTDNENQFMGIYWRVQQHWH